MSEDKGAGAAYLATLKQSTPQTAGAAFARAPVPIAEAPASGRAGSPGNSLERRRSPRYRCQGSAHLREAGGGVATWATFTDISLHGCYVEAMSTFRVGAELGLTMEVNGFRVETGGEVRIVYPNLGMGIIFTTMSAENNERLRELLRSLSRPSVILSPRAAPIPAAPPSDSSPQVANPSAVLQALLDYFDERHILSRDEFFRILRRSQNSAT